VKILTDLHTHTSASTHAYSTLLENAKSAAEKGLELIAMTNHGPAIGDGAHEFHFYSNNMGVLPHEIYGVRILKGIEANVLDLEGTLDIPEMAKPGLDLVIASCHTPFHEDDKVFQPRNEDEFARLYENLAKNPIIDIIGHMNRTNFISNLDYVVPMLTQSGKIIEINTHFALEKWKQELFNLIGACLKHKARICVNSDAHFCYGIGNFAGIDNYLTEIDYPEELIVNLNKATVFEWLNRRRR